MYSQWYTGMAQYDETLIRYTDQFIKPFVIYHIEYLNGEEVNPEFLKRSEFINMISSYKSLFGPATFDWTLS